MSTSIDYASHLVTIYLGIPTLIAGVIGNLINTIVFLSLKTFRQNSCAFYLTIMSMVNTGYLLTGLLTRIMITGFLTDWTQSSIIYCKFRPFCVQLCVLISSTCMCLATIDQYLATCSTPRWQQWSNIKVAHRLIIIFIIIWLLHGIPYWIYFNQIESICSITNGIFQIYTLIVAVVILNGLLPFLINTLFGLLAYRNVRNLAYRTVPLVRRELDKQLTTIVLIQTVSNILSTVPYVIVNILTANSTLMKDSNSLKGLSFASILTIYIFYLNFAIPFYMYICVSGRFRQQLIHVFCRRQRRIAVVNQVVPQLN